MSDTLQPDATEPVASSTQVGSIAECLVAAAIMEASKGQLSPYKPLADDDGTDLLIFNKRSRQAIPLQIKARRTFDDEKGKRVQFDVRDATLALKGADILFVKLEGLSIQTCWLIPAEKLREVARPKNGVWVSVVCANPASNDCFTPFRRASIAEVVAEMLAREL